MKTSKRDFPEEFLHATPEARIGHFKARQIDHAILKQTFNRSISTLKSGAEAKVIVITGPTGVGKSTLARRIYRELMNTHLQEASANRSMLPVLGVNATPPAGTNFNWKDFNFRLLEKNGEILLHNKLSLPRQHELFTEMLYPPNEGSTTDALRRSLEKCIQHRKTKYLIIDEAHHILMVKDINRLEYQFEILKSLTIETDVVIVLVGSYDLLDIRDYSGQLVRRSEILPMHRYDLKSQTDINEFASCLVAFLSKMPLKIVPSLEKDAKYFFIKSAGCIGILKDWLTSSLSHAIEQGLDTFDTAFAEQYAIDNKGLRTIIEEAQYGESRMKDESFESIENLILNGSTKTDQNEAESPSTENPPSSINKRRPGTRNPKRDITGGVQNAA